MASGVTVLHLNLRLLLYESRSRLFLPNCLVTAVENFKYKFTKTTCCPKFKWSDRSFFAIKNCQTSRGATYPGMQDDLPDVMILLRTNIGGM